LQALLALDETEARTEFEMKASISRRMAVSRSFSA